MLQDGTHDLKTLGSGGMRLGPASLVRAVGRVIRSVVGGDSDDSHQHTVRPRPELDVHKLALASAVTSPHDKLLAASLGDAWRVYCAQRPSVTDALLASWWRAGCWGQDLARSLCVQAFLLDNDFSELVMTPPYTVAVAPMWPQVWVEAVSETSLRSLHIPPYAVLLPESHTRLMQAHQSSTEAADTAARVALAAAHAGMGPAQQAQEDARAARLRHTILDDMSGALGDSRRSGSFLPESSPLGAPESSENSFSRSGLAV